ncbi:hypothetical protein LZ023_35345 (plasmid) [Pseudomonas silvicola]|nr:hypothetical protein LZ023_35345 [Pseudomonas silvicola]
MGAIGVVTGFTVRETANKPLYGDTPAASSHLKKPKSCCRSIMMALARIEDIDEQIEALKNKRRNLVAQHPEITQ